MRSEAYGWDEVRQQVGLVGGIRLGRSKATCWDAPHQPVGTKGRHTYASLSRIWRGAAGRAAPSGLQEREETQAGKLLVFSKERWQYCMLYTAAAFNILFRRTG